ncbi:TRAP transporter small permease [Caldinitratiruptor microaerophilus]|uniref:ABC transporter permease n=1 Tax=Caldinitratiruptor microaerophilus TaxID=671077 RepID=A0AA35G9C6_9FIRM|nr:TRAP transporter small permease [Caldinitratiruptor microaerophilus]BDG60154.1 ABC transporter permease [Caldinitratiruptor microaerophilus]
MMKRSAIPSARVTPGSEAARLRRDRIERFLAAVHRWPDYLAGLATAGMLVSVLLQIGSRLAGKPVAWTEEGTRFLFLWIVFLGIGAGFRKAESARVTYFLTKMPRPVRRLAPHIYAATTIGFFVLVLITGSQLVLQQIRSHELGSALMIPMWLVGISVPASAVLGILGVIESLLVRPELLQVEEE